MDRFHDGANEELPLQFDFQSSQTLSSINSAWRFLVASSPEHATYRCAQDYMMKIGHWTNKKQFMHKCVYNTLLLALKSFKEDVILKDIMSPHTLLALFAFLMRAQLRELFWGYN